MTPPSSSIISTLPLAPDWAAVPSPTGWSLSTANQKLEVAILKGRQRETANRAAWIGCGFGRTSKRVCLALEPDENRKLVCAITSAAVRIAHEAGHLVVWAGEDRREIDLHAISGLSCAAHPQ
jgi:hypothetical protein